MKLQHCLREATASITAVILIVAGLAMPTVDVGNPALAMHSARELCGAADSEMLIAALRAFLVPA